MKKILVPTDFSTEAGNALRAAAYISRQSGAGVHILHVLDVSMGGSFSAMGQVQDYSMDDLFVMKLMEVNKKRLHNMADELRETGVSDVTYDVRVGAIYNAITEGVEAMGAELVVMGTKGSSGMAELLVGSNTERIVRFSRVPVLSVKNIPDDFAVRTIVFASNFEADQLLAVSKIKNLQDLFSANLHLVYVNVPNSFTNSRVIRQRMQAFVDRYRLQGYQFTIYNDDSEEKGIIHFAEEVDADLIAVATHGRTGLSHLLSGSIAEDIVNHANRPVLTVNLKGLE
jgi:nucleotide-binding universal stress UspA family protein